MGDREEIRLALALNGGVSLAIWMGGAAVELDAARRAHLGEEDLGEGRSRTVYNGICDGLHRQLVLDVMAGSSAGGINSALLAAASVSGRRLHPDFVRQRWVDLADLDYLMQPTNKAGPASLLQGHLFRKELDAIFEDILSDDDSSPLNDLTGKQAPPEGEKRKPAYPPTIEITATDLAGESLTVNDSWNSSISSSEFRVRFRFDKTTDFTVEKLGAAARSSASFPVAFEPWWVEGTELDASRLTQARWMIDGGLLNNAPIKTALDLIPSRPSTWKSRRILCYINPDPGVEGESEFGEKSGDEVPTAEKVLNRSLKILRSADFVDHLRAIQHARQPAGMFDLWFRGLLTMNLESLEETADQLVPTYNLARARVSIEELTGIAPTVGRVDQLGPLPWLTATAGGRLPYASFNPEGQSGPVRWGLGLRAAQRALHLCVDALRRSDSEDLGENSEQAAFKIDRLVWGLEERYVAGDTPKTLLAAAGGSGSAALGAAYSETSEAVDSAMQQAEVLLRSGLSEGSPLWRGFFGSPGFLPFGNAPTYLVFIRRLQAIEVVRRANNADGPVIETSAPIDFVQLTPNTGCPILFGPDSIADPKTPEDKLCGIRWGHFAAFYKRSWRVNDYMWGRLDGSARVVDVLFDGYGPSSTQLALESNQAEIIAESIIYDGCSEEANWLVAEELAANDPDRGISDFTGMTFEDLQKALAESMTKGPDRARRICKRAAQLEVLTDELDKLERESHKDRMEGSGTPPLEIEGDTMKEKIVTLRGIDDLPTLLGRDQPQETTSNKAMRTVASGAFVGLSAINGINGKVGKILGVARPFLYGFAGIVSKSLLQRLGTVFGLFAAASYLAARAVEVKADEPVLWQDAFSKSTLVAGIAVLVVLGVMFIPLIRTFFGVKRLVNGALAVLILIAGGIVAILPNLGLDWLSDDLSIDVWFTAPGVSVPLWVTAPVLLTVAVVAVGSAFGGITRGRLNKLASNPWSGPVTFWTLIAISALVIGWSWTTQLLPKLTPFNSETVEWEQTLIISIVAANLAIVAIAWISHWSGSHGLGRRSKVRVQGLHFGAISYSPESDVLTLQRKAFRPTDFKYTNSETGDEVWLSPKNGVTSILVVDALSRARVGPVTITHLNDSDERYEFSIPAKTIFRAISNQTDPVWI